MADRYFLDRQRQNLLTELQRWDVLAHKPGQVGLTVQQVAERLHCPRQAAAGLLRAAQEEGIVRFDGRYYTAAEPPAEAAAAQPVRDSFVWLRPEEITVVGNVRRHFDPKALGELADSIKAMGLVEPLVVRVAVPEDMSGDQAVDLPRVEYQLIAGERRLRACALAQVEQVPCIVKRITAAEAAKVQLLENLQRVDLDPIEQAEAFEALVTQHGVKAKDLAEQLGVSEPFISNRRRLLRLPESVRAEVSAQKLPPATAEALVALADVAEPKVIERAARELQEQGVPAHRARAAVVDHLRWRAGWQRIMESCAGDHSACPCRVVINGQAMCRDAKRFDEVERAGREERHRRALEHVRALRADPALKADGDLLSILVGTGQVSFSYCPAAKACPCHRKAGDMAYCIQPKRMSKTDRDPYAEERQKEQREREADAPAAAELAARLSADDERALRWLIASSLSRLPRGWIQPDAVAKELFARIGQPVPKQKEVGGSALHNAEAAVMRALEGRSIRQLKADLLWVWIRSTHPRQRGALTGEQPAPAPAAAVPARWRCDLCGMGHDLAIWRNESDAGAPAGAWIRVCTDACGLGIDLDPEGKGLDIGDPLGKLGWERVASGGLPAERWLADEQAIERLVNRLAGTVAGVRFCRVCGCTDEEVTEACAEAGGCHWVEPDLCSACAEELAEAPAGDADA